jgi:hypothetical protein
VLLFRRQKRETLIEAFGVDFHQITASLVKKGRPFERGRPV